MAAELFAPPSPALDNNADPYAGAKWFFYASGTTTPQVVYADADLITSLGSSVTADSAGRFPAIYFNAALEYRGVLKNADGTAQLHDIDPINTSAIVALGETGGAALVGTSDGSTVQAKLNSLATAASPDATYLVNASGAFARSNKARFGDVIDLAEYIDPAVGTHAANATRLNALFASGAVTSDKVLLLPPWTARVKQLTFPNAVDRLRFYGRGRCSKLEFDETVNDWLVLGTDYDFFEMGNLSMGKKSGNVMTGGYAVKLTDGEGWFLPLFQEMWIADAYAGMSLGTISDTVSADFLHQPRLRDIFMQDIIARGLNFGSTYDPRLDNVSIAMTTASTGIGVLFNSWTQGGYANQCQVIYGDRSWQWGADSGTPQSINAMVMSACVGDQAKSYGFFLNDCDRITLNKPIAGSQQSAATGIYVGANANCSDIEGMQVENMGGHGVVIDAAARQTTIRGGRAVSCSLTTAATYSGIIANNSAQDFVIEGVRALNRAGYYTGTQAYGVAIGNTCDNFVVTNNSLRGNATGGLVNNSLGAANSVVANNLV